MDKILVIAWLILFKKYRIDIPYNYGLSKLGIANASLLERTNQLKIFQQEMDKKLLTQQGHDKIIHMERVSDPSKYLEGDEGLHTVVW